MVLMNRATLEGQVLFFIRDLLSNNIANPRGSTSQWIFKSNPEIAFTSAQYPRVIIDSATVEFKTFGQSAIKNYSPICEAKIEVYSDNQYERDTLTDSIRCVLLNPKLLDSGGDSMNTNMIKPMAVSAGTKDVFINYPKMLRVKEISFTFRYYGG